MTDLRHPLFARFFDRLSRAIEPQVGQYRAELVEGLSGRVLEVGAGNGMNFRRYPAAVEEVTALEPEPYLREKAERAAAGAPVAVKVQAGVADPLEFSDRTFDAAVACLVLCTVPDQAAALGELRRVLKPGGELRFLEHVRAERQPLRALQTIGDASTLWPRIAGGCHAARDTLSAIEDAGFRLMQLRRFDFSPGRPLPAVPHVLGRATAPETPSA